jgi:DNA primase
VPDTDNGPKYLNSPETPLFHKSEVLYGFDKAKFAIKKHNFAVLVEGQFDLLLSHQAGFKNTVATSGTAVSEEVIGNTRAHLQAISRLTPNIILAFDGDEAGQNAAARAALVALALGMNTKVAALPLGMDPADYIKAYGADAWKKVLKESVSFIEHQTERILNKGGSTQRLVVELKSSVFPYLARVQSHIERGSFIERIAALAGIAATDIRTDLENYQKTITQSNIQETATTLEAVTLSPYERFYGLRLLNPNEDTYAELDAELAVLAFHEHVFVPPTIDESRRLLIEMITSREYGAHTDVERKKIAEELVESVFKDFYRTIKRTLTLALSQAEKGRNTEKATELLKMLNELHIKLKE